MSDALAPGDLAGHLEDQAGETVGQRVARRFRSVENSLVEEIRAVASTGMADGRLVAIALTQLELAFLALGKALTTGGMTPVREPPASRITPSPTADTEQSARETAEDEARG